MEWHFPNIKKNDGFTLVELIIVIIIMGAIISIAPVLIDNYLKSQDLSAAAELLSSSIKYAQLNSSTADNASIVFNNADNKYFLKTVNYSDTVTLTRSVYFQDAPDSIIFDYKGIASHTEDRLIILTNSEKNITLKIKKITGSLESYY